MSFCTFILCSAATIEQFWSNFEFVLNINLCGHSWGIRNVFFQFKHFNWYLTPIKNTWNIFFAHFAASGMWVLFAGDAGGAEGHGGPILRRQGAQEGRGAGGRRRRVHDDRAPRAGARLRTPVSHPPTFHLPVQGLYFPAHSKLSVPSPLECCSLSASGEGKGFLLPEMPKDKVRHRDLSSFRKALICPCFVDLVFEMLNHQSYHEVALASTGWRHWYWCSLGCVGSCRVTCSLWWSTWTAGTWCFTYSLRGALTRSARASTLLKSSAVCSSCTPRALSTGNASA